MIDEGEVIFGMDYPEEEFFDMAYFFHDTSFPVMADI